MVLRGTGNYPALFCRLFDISLLMQCSLADHDTCVEMGGKTFEDIVSDEWFCGRYCKEVHIYFPRPLAPVD
jgi:hypothetical protein